MRVYSFIQVLKSNVNFKESFNDAGQQQLTVALSNWKVKDILNNLPWYQKRVIFVASLCCHPALVNISWWPCYLTIFDNKSFSFNLRVFFLWEDAWFFMTLPWQLIFHTHGLELISFKFTAQQELQNDTDPDNNSFFNIKICFYYSLDDQFNSTITQDKFSILHSFTL